MAYKIEEIQERAGPFGGLRVNKPGPYNGEEKRRSGKFVALDRKSPPIAKFAKGGAPSSSVVGRRTIGMMITGGRGGRRRLLVRG